MTTPAPASFATVQDVRSRGYVVPEADEPAWGVTLGDVSDALRARARRVGKDLDGLVDADALTARLATRVTVEIANRFKSAPRPAQTAPQVTQQTFGPFSRSFNTSDVAIYARADELSDLGISAAPAPRGTFGDDATVPDVFAPLRRPVC